MALQPTPKLQASLDGRRTRRAGTDGHLPQPRIRAMVQVC